MKNTEIALLSLISSLLIAINTDWCKPAKLLVIISSFLGIFCGARVLLSARGEKDET